MEDFTIYLQRNLCYSCGFIKIFAAFFNTVTFQFTLSRIHEPVWSNYSRAEEISQSAPWLPSNVKFSFPSLPLVGNLVLNNDIISTQVCLSYFQQFVDVEAFSALNVVFSFSKRRSAVWTKVECCHILT